MHVKLLNSLDAHVPPLMPVVFHVNARTIHHHDSPVALHCCSLVSLGGCGGNARGVSGVAGVGGWCAHDFVLCLSFCCICSSEPPRRMVCTGRVRCQGTTRSRMRSTAAGEHRTGDRRGEANPCTESGSCYASDKRRL